jgi:ABC-type transport system involved in cytochrome c biogenesis permease subunit
VLQAVHITYWLAMALYASATVLYAYYFSDKRRQLSIAATFLTGAGFLFNTVSIGLRSISTHGTQMAGANSLVLAAWALVLVYFFVEHVIRLKVYGTVLVPISALLLGIAQVLGVNNVVTVALAPSAQAQLASWRVGFHVALVLLANAGFAIGGAASGVYLLQETQLKRRTANKLLRRLPSLAQTDMIARRAIVVSYPVYTAGLLLGITRAIEVAPTGWWFDPRVMLAGIAWLIFGVYLFLRYQRGLSGRVAAWIALAGLAVVGVTGIVARTVSAGFHVFGLG